MRDGWNYRCRKCGSENIKHIGHKKWRCSDCLEEFVNPVMASNKAAALEYVKLSEAEQGGR